MSKITGARIDRLPPCRMLRTSLRPSPRLRKRTQPKLRRLRSGRYPSP